MLLILLFDVGLYLWSIIVYYCCPILVQFQSNVHFQMTVEDSPCGGQPNLQTNFLTVTFQDEHLSLIVLPILFSGPGRALLM